MQGVSRAAARAYCCGMLSYAVVRVWMFANATPLLTRDSIDYLHPTEPLASPAFFSGYKPWLVPLYWKALDDSLTVGTWLQLAISVLAWAYLARELGRAVGGGRLGVVAGCAVLGFSVTPTIAQWDPAVLSESLSLSLGAVLVALLLRVLNRPSRQNVLAIAAVGLLWSATRDTNAYLALAFLVVAGTGVFLRSRRLGLALIVSGLAIFGASYWSSSSPSRWEVMNIDLINERVLGDPSALSYFRAHAMPAPPDLRVHLFRERDTRRYETDPLLANFRPWLLRRSRSTYMGYLITHPSYSLRQPLAQIGLLNSPNGLNFYRPEGFRTVLPPPIAMFAYIPSGSLTLLWSLLACGVTFTLSVSRLARRSWLVGAVMIATTVPQAILVWDAEPREVARHALMVGVFDRLGLIIVLAFAIDAVAALRARADARPKRTDEWPTSPASVLVD